MIAAAEPVEFIPCGRKIVKEHCGPLIKKTNVISSEFILLDRMRNVNLSADEHFNESWTIREVHKSKPISSSTEEISFLSTCVVNSEEELYFSGHTAVWTCGRGKASSEICYTTEDPIKFAFFCTKNFLDPDYKIEDSNNNLKKRAQLKDEKEDFRGIAIIDSTSLKVYSKNGENLVTAIESPISKIWITKYCVLIEKEASSAIIDGHAIPMPRIFSLSHALDDMFPTLLKSQLLVNYITEDEFKVNNK